MADDRVSVTCEWARFGKVSDAAGYGILACSDGVVGGGQFAYALAEFWPGSLSPAELPQVTVSWLAPAPDEYDVGLAIHRSGRNGVITDYFCAPFTELAAGPVSYLSLFDEVAKIRLPPASRAPIAITPRRVPWPVAFEPLASQVAPQLAAEPVCVLGAEHVSVTGRLKFIDSVASFLPGDQRCTLSASTWASSTYREHNLRLFFASADRGTGDYVVYWDEDPGEPAGSPANIPSRHVFISYPREESEKADQLHRALEAAGLPVWRDTVSLWPGDDWRARIRRAITQDALVFIACFSSHSLAQGPHLQNEEITWAIQQLSAYDPDQPWFIPVKFDDCTIPDRDLGGNRSLSSLLPIDLFGPRTEENLARVVEAVRRILSRR
jgi:hypothetical protein